jgi:hypothetical protein
MSESTKGNITIDLNKNKTTVTYVKLMILEMKVLATDSNMQ